MNTLDRYKALVAELGGATKAAAALGVKQGTASGWTLGKHGMSAAVALRAEVLTNRRFLAKDLCPELAEFESPAA